MLRAILNKSWRQHPTKHQPYGHLSLITKTIQVSRTRHAGHCWRSRDELISDVLLSNPTYGWAKAGRPARTYIQQLCEDTGCSPEDLPEAMSDREKWRERVRDIRATSTTWWWWRWWCIGGHSSLSLSLYLSHTFIYNMSSLSINEEETGMFLLINKLVCLHFFMVIQHCISSLSTYVCLVQGHFQVSNQLSFSSLLYFHESHTLSSRDIE